MRFIELNAAAAGLRHSLRNYVGENALNEIYVRPPAGEDDEASFMRLVNWTYVFFSRPDGSRFHIFRNCRAAPLSRSAPSRKHVSSSMIYELGFLTTLVFPANGKRQYRDASASGS